MDGSGTASWLNVWGPDRISQQLSIKVTARRHQKNVLKWPLHWVRSFPCKDGRFFFVSLVSPGLSKILVESAGRSIQSQEIGAALSVRTCEWLVTQLPSEKVVHTRNPLLQDFDSAVWFYILPIPPSLQFFQQNITTWQLQTAYHLYKCPIISTNVTSYQQMSYQMNSFTTSNSQP